MFNMPCWYNMRYLLFLFHLPWLANIVAIIRYWFRNGDLKLCNSCITQSPWVAPGHRAHILTNFRTRSRTDNNSRLIPRTLDSSPSQTPTRPLLPTTNNNNVRQFCHHPSYTTTLAHTGCTFVVSRLLQLRSIIHRCNIRKSSPTSTPR